MPIRYIKYNMQFKMEPNYSVQGLLLAFPCSFVYYLGNITFGGLVVVASPYSRCKIQHNHFNYVCASSKVALASKLVLVSIMVLNSLYIGPEWHLLWCAKQALKWSRALNVNICKPNTFSA